jgi:hypothetical protein
LTNTLALRYIGMITITDTTQRIFFDLKQSIPTGVELCGVWLLKYGVWSDCGVWDDSALFVSDGDIPLPTYELKTGAGTVKKTAALIAEKESRLYSIAADSITEGVNDDDYVLNIFYVDNGAFADQYIERVEGDNGTLFTSRGIIVSRTASLTGCEDVQELIYTTRLKVKKSKVEIKPNTQKVTRKVNRSIPI